jgi:hypothetical protein
MTVVPEYFAKYEEGSEIRKFALPDVFDHKIRVTGPSGGQPIAAQPPYQYRYYSSPVPSAPDHYAHKEIFLYLIVYPSVRARRACHPPRRFIPKSVTVLPKV